MIHWLQTSLPIFGSYAGLILRECALVCSCTMLNSLRMFVSRTVAAEVCMEAKTNEAGYAALKQLDKSGGLCFELW
jgi:hypothetical protein